MGKHSSGHSKLGQPRSLTELARDRKKGNQPPRETILIVCEGLETEPNYFEALRNQHKLRPIEVCVLGEGCAPITLVRKVLEIQAERHKQARRAERRGESYDPPYDEVWCVFDTEQIHLNESFHRAVNLAQSNKVRLAISNPAFEYWYLLHFRETDQPFADADEVKRALKRHIPEYEKNMDVFPKIVGYTEAALQRAQRTLNRQDDPDNLFPNPSTSVCHLVEKIRSMAIL